MASCKKAIKKFAKENGFKQPLFCHLNMAKSHCKDGIEGIKNGMLRSIASALKIDQQEKRLSVFEQEFKKKTLVLVLDEIDMLFKTNKEKAATWFKTLVDWAEDKTMRFSMIGISNTNRVNDTEVDFIRELGHVSNSNGLILASAE